MLSVAGAAQLQPLLRYSMSARADKSTAIQGRSTAVSMLHTRWQWHEGLTFSSGLAQSWAGTPGSCPPVWSTREWLDGGCNGVFPRPRQPRGGIDHHTATHERVLHSVPQAPNRSHAIGSGEPPGSHADPTRRRQSQQNFNSPVPHRNRKESCAGTAPAQRVSSHSSLDPRLL